MSTETPLIFRCGGDDLVGILHRPSTPPAVGVVIVVGGPQYRAGSHRQFLLLARALAARGIGVLRFDCRGMGDSGGDFAGFESIEPDIAAAVETMFREAPSVKRVALWGLCDAVPAICSYAHRDRRVAGITLLNPWVRTEAGLARAQLKHYYLGRLFDRGFLRKVLSGKFNPVASLRSLFGDVARASGLAGSRATSGDAPANPLAGRMADNLRRYDGAILLVTSGRDLTAKEFEDAARGSAQWRKILAGPRVTRRQLAAADHTFSRRVWRDEVAEWTSAWIESWADDGLPASSRSVSAHPNAVVTD